MMIIPSPPPGEGRARGRPRLRGHQLGDPEQVVGGGDEVSGELRASLPSAQTANRQAATPRSPAPSPWPSPSMRGEGTVPRGPLPASQ